MKKYRIVKANHLLTEPTYFVEKRIWFTPFWRLCRKQYNTRIAEYSELDKAKWLVHHLKEYDKEKKFEIV